MKILSTNIRYFVTILRFVMINAFFGSLVPPPPKKNTFCPNNSVSWARSAQIYGVYCISYLIKFAILCKNNVFVSKIENTCLKCRHLLTPCFLVLSSKSCKFSLQKTLLQIAFSWQRFAASHYNIDKYFSATSRSKLNLFQIILPDNFLADCFFSRQSIAKFANSCFWPFCRKFVCKFCMVTLTFKFFSNCIF